MAENSDTSGTPRTGGSGSGSRGAGGGNSGGGTGGGGNSPGNNANRNRNRSRNRNRGRNRPAGGSGGGNAGGTSAGGTSAGGTNGTRSKGGGQRKGQGSARRGGSGGSAGGSGSSSGGSQRSGQQNRNRGGGGRGSGRSRTRSPGTPSAPRTEQPRTAVALAPAPSYEAPGAADVAPSLGAPHIFPAEVAANRRRAVRLCAWTAVVPALLVGLLLGIAVNLILGIVAFVLVGAAVMYGLWRLAPSYALKRIGAVAIDEHDHPRLYNLTDGLCATFGLAMPALFVVDDDVPNACALGRDARRSDLVVTSGLLRRADPIELEGVLAHELAHVKRGDNGVSCVGITLGSLFGGERTLRRCLGESREYRADVVGASAVRYPRGLLGALNMMMEAPAPGQGSLFAAANRLGPTRWVWIDPSVGHRGDPLVPGDLDATSVRAAALSEW